MTADHAAQLLVAVGLMLIMASVARALQRKRVALLKSAGAQALPACTCTITRTLSWLRLPRAEAYLLDGVLVVFTHNGRDAHLSPQRAHGAHARLAVPLRGLGSPPR